jgi:hypothetical protein
MRNRFTPRRTTRPTNIDREGFTINEFFDPADPSAPCCFVCFGQNKALAAYTMESARVRMCQYCADLFSDWIAPVQN